MRIVKTPMMIARGAGQRGQPKPPPPGKPVPGRRPPLLDPDAGAELDATIDWLAHLAAGRIEVR